ncbi:ORT2 [Cyberlindnera jadinii]|uniref:ORT2 protein n=1 Tax=Cyberlindnera jadinii (strain ATCC 18201 / CBS 1600 / BCRC 20928 / JCM 3617 / NBRC 0987 / NRRL Y-1542) TaxID=983966 RepID=A0A0H5C247_CYBJN|nr:ORT2 [Cyberlindnera jadinii]
MADQQEPIKHHGQQQQQQKTVLTAITGELDTSNAIHILPQFLMPWRAGVLSYSASLLSTIVGYPLDSIKTRMQTYRFDGILHCFTKTVRDEGVRGLFRGLTAPLLSTSFTKAIGVTVYTTVKPYAALLQLHTLKPITVPDDSSKKLKAMILAVNNAPVSFLAGAMSGCACSAFASPFEFTKLFQQIYVLMQADLNLSPRRMPNTTWQVVKQIRRHEGILGLYSGYRFHLMRDSLGSALYFSVYETAKILLEGFSTPQGTIAGTNIPMGAISITISGALSGVFSWILVFPIDTVKSLTQKDIVSNIIRGLALKQPKPIMMRSLRLPNRSMYRGLSVSVMRSVITSTVFFTAFEYFMKHIT